MSGNIQGENANLQQELNNIFVNKLRSSRYEPRDGEQKEAVKRITEILRSLEPLSQPPSHGVKQKLWDCLMFVTNHRRWFDQADVDDMLSAAQTANHSGGVFSLKQAANIAKLKVVSYHDTDYGDDRSWVPYDGPDDPDRYLGHGEFDTDDGYWEG